ncbi:MAG TPA: hypothetical protein EYQ21_07140 [Flavobacteriales bacterium]|jgi:hypothetical protein|nr:hypothetical protein [Flavobacteriales bacterium]
MSDKLTFKDGQQISVVFESLVSAWDAFKCVLDNSEEIQHLGEFDLDADDLMKNISKVDDGIMGLMDSFEEFTDKNA